MDNSNENFALNSFELFRALEDKYPGNFGVSLNSTGRLIDETILNNVPIIDNLWTLKGLCRTSQICECPSRKAYFGRSKFFGKNWSRI